MDYTSHYSVLKKECLDFLTENVTEEYDKYFFGDLTFGGGGHTFGLLGLDDRFYLRSTDQDPEALKNGYENIKKLGFDERSKLFATNFEKFESFALEEKEVFEKYGGYQGILIDLGVSSHHFDKGDRGFSFRMEAPLDMRMDNSNDSIRTASYYIQNSTLEELTEIFRDYGEEKNAYKIAKRIVERRNNEPLETTTQLADLIHQAYPKDQRYGKTHPATKCFQALRIVVNRELEVIETIVPKLLPLLRVGGRIAIISFHSLEDRIVKNIYKQLSRSDIPCSILTKKPIIPSEEEISHNSRSRSAKLRVLERVREKKSKNKYEQFSKVSKTSKD